MSIPPHKLPKHKDVTDFDIGPNRVSLVRLTDENRANMVEFVLSQYDYTCSICGEPIAEPDRDTSVCAGWDNGKMLIAHRACFAQTGA